jgi:hypothetical protein
MRELRGPDVWIEQGSFLARLVEANDRFLVARPGVRYYAAREAVVVVGSVERLYKVCHIRFHRDGRILVQAPWFESADGVIGHLRWPHTRRGSQTLSFEPGFAAATAHRLKLDHPPDGRVHLSAEKTRTVFWRQSFPLAGGEGFVFQLDALGVEGHKFVPPDQPLRSRRVHLPFIFDGSAPRGFAVFGEWLRRERFLSPVVGQPNGPLITYREAGGNSARAFLLAQPDGGPFPDRVLRVTCGATPPATSDTERSIVLRGGWDADHDTMPEGRETGCLAFMYPILDPSATLARLGTVDRAALAT